MKISTRHSEKLEVVINLVLIVILHVIIVDSSSRHAGIIILKIGLLHAAHVGH